MKKLMALILAAALAFGSSVMVFANEEAGGVENIPFTGTEASFIGTGGLITGRYPVLPGQAALSQNVSNFMTDTYYEMINNNQIPTLSGNMLLFNFTVEESLTTARIDITALDRFLAPVVIRTIYVNKANNAQITAAQAAAMIAAEAEAVEVIENGEEAAENGEEIEVEVEVVEIHLVQLRAHAEHAGFTVTWNAETAMVTVANDEVEFSLAAGSPVAVAADGEEFVLETAPINLDGTMYVPISFFTELLGVEIILVPITAVPVIEEAEEVEEEYEAEEYEEEYEDEEEEDEDEE